MCVFQSRVIVTIVYFIVHSMNFCTQEDFAATKLCSDFWRVNLVEMLATFAFGKLWFVTFRC